MAKVLSADGPIDTQQPPGDSCCPLPICQIDFCGLLCSFIGLLPDGPMWDRQKEEARAYVNECVCPADAECPPQPCASMALYAAYVGSVLYDLLLNALWPSLRESDPSTAVTTLDDWLERYQWQDCHDTACRNPCLGELTPYEVPGPCGPIFCPPEVPEELECAVKRGIVLALKRLQMGGIPTMQWINWVIEPLGAVLSAHLETRVINGREVECWREQCKGQKFNLCYVGDQMIDACPPEECEIPVVRRIPAYVDRDQCNMPAGAQERVYPGVLAAECIVLSILQPSPYCEPLIIRCC